MASIAALEAPSTYHYPIPPNATNLRFVENRIIIDGPHTFVYNYATTWANLGKWLPMTSFTSVVKGEDNVPSEIGDVLYEGIKDSVRTPGGEMVASKVYTVVVRVPGFQWIVTGTEEGQSWYRNVAMFSTFPLEGNKTLFVRVYEQACQTVEEPVNAALDAKIIQGGLELLKEVVEEEYRST